jgi:DNA-binding NarL/FixJ family response regulator
VSALRAGAHGYVVKGVSSSALIDAILGVANGEGYVSPALAARLLHEMRPSKGAARGNDPLADLTPREEEILQGLSNKEIARKLDLQEKSVKHHMTRILDKLHVRNRTEAALLLRDNRRQSS